MRRLLHAAPLLALAFCAAAQQAPAGPGVALSGTMGQQALLVISGGPPRAVRIGDTLQGVKVISVGSGEAVVELGGQRRTLRAGEAPVAVGGAPASGGSSTIVLTAGAGGHFYSQGAINSRAVQFLVDTGASVVSLGEADAQRLGLDYKQGQRVQMMTANGAVPAYRMRLASVRVGEVEVSGVEAVVTPAAMPYVLLGNSFLGRFQMRRDNDQMTLERRY